MIKMEAFAPVSKLVQVHDYDLSDVPLHPAFARDKWDYAWPNHVAPQPLGKGREGFWEASNPVVWELMLPSLRMASLILTNAET